MNVGPLDRRGTIEYPVRGQEPTYGTPIIAWAVLATVWCNVYDVPPSRSEAVKQGLSVALNRTRIRYRWRDDVTSAMRITLAAPDSRVLQIVAGPAELGRKQFSECMCESLS